MPFRIETLTTKTTLQRHILLLCLFLLSFLTTAQEAKSLKPDPIKQKEWMAQSIEKMMKFSPNDSVAIIKQQSHQYDAFKRFTYRLVKEGMISFGENDWVYMLSSSSHETPEIGDVTIAMDHQHNFYVVYGHVCGGIVHFICDTLEVVTSSADFFAYFKEDIDLKPWNKMVIE